jgi:serine/threonine protein kinase
VAGREGTTLGQYRLIRSLGAGAIGEVYLAEGPAPAGAPSQVAVKVLTGGASDATAREIVRQAEAAGALQQSHILPVYGVLQQAGTLAVVMAFAPGGSLGDTLQARTPAGERKLALPLPNGVVARLVNQLARALAAAHGAGLAHGDLKPSNIFVRTAPNGQPLAAVADFGQSTLTSAAAALAARSATAGLPAWIAGQLLFAAPEQLRGECSPASDQYGLASIAYLLVTGELPFTGDAPALLAAISSASPSPPSQLNATLAPAAESVLLRALAKAPERRYPSVTDFALALDDALAVSVSAGASGVTQQFAQLEGSHPGMRRPPTGANPGASHSGLRIYDRTESSRGRHRAPPAEALEASAPAVNRRLGIVTAAAVLLAMLACVLGFRAFEGSSVLPRIQLGGGFISVPTPTVDAAAVAKARTAEAKLHAATSGTPAFSDPLTSDTHHWSADGKTVFFARDGLHLHNQSTANIAAVDAPGSQSALSGVVTQVDVTVVTGNVSDEAGLRLFVQPGNDGSQDYYGYLVSPEGRYEVVLHQNGSWLYLHSGYASALKPGLDQTNRLAVLVDGAGGTMYFYANGQFVTQIHLYHTGPVQGPIGLMVLNDGAEASFSHYALYSLGT